MTIDLFERYAALDPAKSAGIHPEWSAMAPVPLSTLDGREPDMQTQQQTPKQPNKPKPRRTGLLVAAIAAAVVLIVGAVALLNNGSDSNLAPADGGSSVSTSDALAVSNAYFVALNAGDVEGVMTLFAPGATFNDNLTGDSTFDEAEMKAVWNAAQGTKFTSEGCSAKDAFQEQAISVSCTAATLDALVQAVGAPPVPTDIRMTIGPDGITSVFDIYGSPDFKDSGIPFDRWMQTNNPADAGRVDFGDWTTIEEAQEYGELVAGYAKEWATYLEDNNCSYQDDC
ncbi:MAG: hypothetical protein BMS9Abin17_0935 [Acidimicrobiia bacterium]|nr:MAG: hypothetical protein BMS9Abin17_0935 [Acidimicrobiia bacterium]